MREYLQLIWENLALIAAISLIGMLLLIILVKLVSVIRRHLRKKPCIHCRRKTVERSGGVQDHCEAQQPCCSECQLQHQFEKVPDHSCPACKNGMSKQLYLGRFIIHCCPNETCGTVITTSSDISGIYEQGYWDAGHKKDNAAFRSQLVG